MAEPDTSESGGWWSAVIASAKEKSVNALSATKRDLAEFVSVLRNDTTTAVMEAGHSIKGLIQKESEDMEVGSNLHSAHGSRSSLPLSSPAMPYDRSQAQLFTLQTSLDTYLTDPAKGEEEYKQWTSQFDIQSHQQEISRLLVSCPHVRSMHGQLVPAKVSYESFWQRYFFKRGLLQQEEQRRADLMARARPRQEDLKWDEEEGEEGEGGGGEKGEERGEGEEKGEGRGGGGGGEEREEAENITVAEIKSDHHRSESSDSFVCVSEDLPQSERSHTSPETIGTGADWECLGSETLENITEEDLSRKGGGGGGGGGEGGEGGKGQKESASGEEGEETDGGGTIEAGEGEGGAVSESSDWESWDD